jgi:hypothetical protein
MATVFSANSSSVTVNGEAVPGVRTIDYRLLREQDAVYALGSDERVAVFFGPMRVQGRVAVASANPALDALAASGAAFQLIAQLRHSDTQRSVTFDDCYMQTKEFAMGAGGAGETVYLFSATRLREEDGG